MQKLDPLLASLQTNPREREYLDVGDALQWSEEERAEARRLLVAAAEAGDDRAVRALWFTGPRQEVTWTLTSLLQSKHDRVAIEAASELQDGRRKDLATGFLDRLAAGRLDHQGLVRGFDLLLKAGADAAVIDLLRTSTNEYVRTVIIERLWEHLRLDLWPSLPWTSLGLLRRRLALPVRSFRVPALIEFETILAIRHPAIAGYAAVTTTGGFPKRLTDAVARIRESKLPFEPLELAALGPEMIPALIVTSAELALNQQLPGGLRALVQLSGFAHRDLLETAAASTYAPIANVAKELLAGG